MRVISGLYRGVKLEGKYNKDKVRPTTDKVKESLFNIIQFEIADKLFLDLFSGTGQIGIEAISRGAKKVVFVDNCPDSLTTIKVNLSKINKIKNLENISVIRKSADSFLSTNMEKFDIVFIDPPYSESVLLDKILFDVTSHVQKDGIIIAEMPCKSKISTYYNDFILQNRYSYGKIALCVYRRSK